MQRIRGALVCKELLGEEYVSLVDELAVFFGNVGVILPIQLLKVQEEAGEAAAALIGAYGYNPRKGVTHSKEDIANELADVVISALIGIRMAGFDLNDVITKQAAKTYARLDQFREGVQQ